MNETLTLASIPAKHVSRSTAAATLKLAKHELRDVVRSRWIALYAAFFFGLAEALLRFGGGATTALISLANVVLLVVPMVGIVFGTMYLYAARDFIELLLSQPIHRRQLYLGLYAGLVLPLSAAFLVGTALPFLWHGLPAGNVIAFATLLAVGTFMTLIFVGFAFPIAVWNDERIRGLGIVLAAWLGLTIVYDGLVLLVLQAASSYPTEGLALGTMLLNPIDLGRTLLLMQFDVAALMGYTGAVFERFFGSALGTVTAGGLLVVWAVLPVVVGMRRFHNKDF